MYVFFFVDFLIIIIVSAEKQVVFFYSEVTRMSFSYPDRSDVNTHSVNRKKKKEKKKKPTVHIFVCGY